MIAAIYARKSTEQTGTAEEAKSVTRQIDHARAYAATKGWTVAEAHVYVDDGISGAEFAKRPGRGRRSKVGSSHRSHRASGDLSNHERRGRSRSRWPGPVSELEERLERRQTQDHPAGLLVLLGRHADMLGHGMDIAQRPLERVILADRPSASERMQPLYRPHAHGGGVRTVAAPADPVRDGWHGIGCGCAVCLS